VNDADAPHPGRRDETGQIGCSTAAEADDLVVALQTDPTAHVPAECGDLQVLTRFGVGNLHPMSIETLLREELANLLGGGLQRRLIKNRHRVGSPGGDCHLLEEPPANGDPIG